MDGRRLLLGIGVVAFVIIVSVAIFKIDWGGGTPIANLRNQTNIADYFDTDVQVRMTSRGPIINNQEHQELQITVGRTNTIGQLLAGYEGGVARTQQTTNNQVSYKAFLSALHNAEFTKVKLANPKMQYDGACSDGTRYTFEFLGAGDDAPEPTWATSCAKRDGTFDGELAAVKKLFNTQLPQSQYNDLTDDADF